MNDVAIWLFAGAVYGTLAFPFVVGAAWSIDVAMLVWAVGLGLH